MDKEKSFSQKLKENFKKEVKKRIKEKFVDESHVSDDSHILDRMTDVMYGVSTKMPVIGKYVKAPLDKIDALNKTKIFTSKVFKPIFPFFKVDKKYTEILVKDAPKTSSKEEV
jgi:hypothetical protein